ncbi:MAG TPA: TRAP transporter small permease subunit [Casimicrobiaceae bacterium]|nr:TRAP transporter small permease subunit [Casimicrobiaceae bacterium]
MPSLTFVMPHWLYWSGLIFFPLIAAYSLSRQRANPPDTRPSLFIAYMFWLLAGYLGIHRFYIRSAWAFVFIPAFIGIVYCTSQAREVRDDLSRTFAAMEESQTAVASAKDEVGRGTPDAAAALAKSETELKSRTTQYEAAKAVSDGWKGRARLSGIALGVMLLIDAVLLPGAVRRRRAAEAAQRQAEAVAPQAPSLHEGGIGEDPTLKVHTPFTDVIDRLSALAGRYVAWWALIAVFAYYYEVIGRFLFNSPTIWVHESTFLMFGMQYMLSGAFAYREDQHVRVDVVYAKFSPRGKAIADIITSVFFFIFVGTMFWTGARFAMDAIQVGEHSFTEWGIQYWPVKLAIPVGAALLLLQGISKLAKDIMIVARNGA